VKTAHKTAERRKSVRQSPGRILAQAQAVLSNDHFVHSSGLHSDTYIKKDAIYANPANTIELGYQMAELARRWGAEVVAAPAMGGINLATATALGLSQLTGNVVQAVYVEQVTIPLSDAVRDRLHDSEWSTVVQAIHAGNLNVEDIFVRLDKFELRRGYDKIVHSRRVLVAEDVLTTGKSTRRTIEAVRNAGGEVIGVVAMCNRGGVMESMLGVDKLSSLIKIVRTMYPEDLCALCKNKVPINTEFGHGKEFLARQGRRGIT
jgi:orotate phosphoribosyltransferase